MYIHTLHVQIRQTNPWLVYSETLHRLREFGCSLKEFDLIDEAPLSADQMGVVVDCLLFNGNKTDLPDPQGDWPGFIAAVTKVVNRVPRIFDTVSNRMEPPVLVKKLSQLYASGGQRGQGGESALCALS